MKIIVKILLFLATNNLLSQPNLKNFNFIIVVDEQVNHGIISGVNFSAALSNDSLVTFPGNYCPGNLSLSLSDYKRLLDDNVSSVHLFFTYTEYCKNKEFCNSYNIDIKKAWLESDFYILYVFNTDKRKYKKLLKPIKNKNYTFEYDYPGGAIRRIRIKSTKECE